VFSDGPGHAERLRALLLVMPPATEFRCEIRAQRDLVTFVPRGEIDLAGAAALDADFRAARDLGFEGLAVDLRGAQFIDSAGTETLERWKAAADREGFAFTVRPERLFAVE
jgi:anti-anti-sigma regulatory factor